MHDGHPDGVAAQCELTFHPHFDRQLERARLESRDVEREDRPFRRPTVRGQHAHGVELDPVREQQRHARRARCRTRRAEVRFDGDGELAPDDGVGGGDDDRRAPVLHGRLGTQRLHGHRQRRAGDRELGSTFAGPANAHVSEPLTSQDRGRTQDPQHAWIAAGRLERRVFLGRLLEVEGDDLASVDADDGLTYAEAHVYGRCRDVVVGPASGRCHSGRGHSGRDHPGQTSAGQGQEEDERRHRRRSPHGLHSMRPGRRFRNPHRREMFRDPSAAPFLGERGALVIPRASPSATMSITAALDRRRLPPQPALEEPSRDENR